MRAPNARRRWLAGAGVLLGTGAGTLAAVAAWAQAAPVIRVSAKKFAFTPAELRLKKGQPVVLEFTTEDVFMGFSAPDLGVRSDIVPGKTTQLRIVPQKAGTFPFVCDVFCGDKHEEMEGSIVVS